LSTLKKFAGQTAIYGLSTILARLLNFILTPLFVKVYPAKVYGIFTYMFSVASMVNAVLAFGMETTFFRYLNKYEDKKEKVYSNTFLTVLTISIIFLAFTTLFPTDIAIWLQDGKITTTVTDYVRFVKYFIYILVLDALAVIPFAKVRADGRPIRYGIIKAVNIVVFVGLNLIFIIVIPLMLKNHWAGAESISSWYRPGWVGYVFISNLVASAITLLLLIPELSQLKLSFDRQLSKEMFLYSLPVLIANMSFIINENIDKFFLGRLLPVGISEQQLGIYGACCKLAIFLSIFVQAFRLGAEPFFFSHAKNKNSGETYSRIMTWFVIGVCLIFVGLVANIEILKYFIPGDGNQKFIYWSGLDVVPILLFGYVSLGIYMNLSIWYKLSDQTRYGLYISGAGAIVTVVLNLIFIPKYSYMAAAWVSLTAYVTMMVLSYILGQKNYPIPYDLKKNIAYLLSSAVVVYLSYVIFHRNLIAGNALLLAFAAITAFAERKELKQLLANR
jgi:O-antigen/teichoic acid export membrane protein